MEKNELNTQQIQQEIDKIQDIYEKWLETTARLKTVQKDWQQATVLMKKMTDFYFKNQKWMHYHQAINEKKLNITYKNKPGTYHIMDEDTIWDASIEQDNLAWQWLRLSLKVLDPKYR